MRAMMPPAASSDPVRCLDQIPTRMAKVESDALGSSDRVGLRWADTMIESAVAHYGSVKALAISLGNVDPSQMMREFKAGNFRLLERADEDAKADIASRVHLAYGPLTTPQARGRRLTKEIRQKADELDQLLEHIA